MIRIVRRTYETDDPVESLVARIDAALAAS